MSLEKKVFKSVERRVLRTRNKLKSKEMPHKVSVFRSLKHIYAQIIDINEGKTIVSCSSLEMKDLTGSKKEVAQSIGRELAQRAKQQGIEKVMFDRGRYLYHGRIKELAQGLREGGLKV